jgi:lysophospholipase L1-like esterase
MKALLAGIVAAIFSIFGGHQTITNSAANAAAAAASVTPSAIVAATSSTSTALATSTAASSTIIYQTINQLVIERIVTQSTTTGVSENELDTRLTELENKITAFFYTGISSVASSPVPHSIASGGVWNTIAGTNKIDQLSGIAISNSSIDASSLPDLSGAYLSIASTTTARSTLGLAYAVPGNFSNIPQVAAWGDSLTFGIGSASYPSQLSKIYGYYVYNGGVSGLQSTSIANLMLAATDKYSWPTIIWAGRNNYSSAATVEADIASMVAALQSVGNTNYLILGIVNGNFSTEYSGGSRGVCNADTGQTGYNQIVDLNCALATTYGSHFLDIRTYMIDRGLSIAGIATSSDDQTDYNNDVPPRDLVNSDGIHFNSIGNSVIARAVAAALPVTQSATNNNIITSDRLAAILSSPPAIGGVNPSIGNFSSISIDGTNTLYASSTNKSTLVGQGGLTLQASSTVLYDTAVGYEALNRPSNSGIYNTGIGAYALQSNSTGNYNSALGVSALNFNSTGFSNSAFGVNALYSNTVGNYNSAFGGYALYANTGNYNSALGMYALYANTTGSSNSAQGMYSLYSNTTGSYNSAFGAGALNFNKTGNYNSALGEYALYNNTSATSSTALGYQAAYGSGGLYNNQGGVYLGYRSGYQVATGSDYDTLLGYQSGLGVTTGARNVLIGQSTIAASYNQVTTGSNNIAIGNDVAIASSTLSNQLNIGNLIYGTSLDGTGSTISSGNVAIGTTSPGAGTKLNVAGMGLFTGGSVNPLDGTAAGVEVGYNTGGDYGFLQAVQTGVAFKNLILQPSSGSRVGIGTTSPGTILDVRAGSGGALAGSVSGIAFVGTGMSKLQIGYDTSTTKGYAWLGATKDAVTWSDVVINPAGTGNVGIGTTGPLSKLDVNGGLAVGSYAGANAAPSNGLVVSGSIGIGTSTPADSLVIAGDSKYLRINANSQSDKFYLRLGEDYSSTQALKLYQGTSLLLSSNWSGANLQLLPNGGNLGIGTTSPYALLSLSNSATTAANTPLFVIASTTGGTATTTVFSIASTGNVTITGSAATCTLGNGASATSCSSSDQRLKDDINTIDSSTSLAAVESLRPVSFKWNQWMVGNGASTSTQFGFIAQEIMNTFPNLVTLDANSHYYKLDYQGLFAPIVGAIQALAQEVGNFADSFTTKELTFTRATGDEIDVQKLCIGSTCVTEGQLKAMLAAAGSSGASSGGSSSGNSGGTSNASSTPDTPPVIQINGANPATIHVGDSYADLGATITGPQADLNLGLKYFLNGALVSNIVIDTSAAATDTIDYVATDQAGNTSTSTRTVIVEAPAPTVPPISNATTSAATTTDATATAQ